MVTICCSISEKKENFGMRRCPIDSYLEKRKQYLFINHDNDDGGQKGWRKTKNKMQLQVTIPDQFWPLLFNLSCIEWSAGLLN